jgi:muconolactone delta-isomerase
MRFLIVTQASSPFPPEMAMALTQAMKQWADTHRASGKMEQIWNFAGLAGGGGILNVDSHEELAAIMSGFPFAPFSKIEVYARSDLDAGLDAFTAAIQQMMGSGGG